MLNLCIILLYIVWIGVCARGDSLVRQNGASLRQQVKRDENNKRESINNGILFALDGRRYQENNNPYLNQQQNALGTMVKHTDKVHAGILLFALCWRIFGVYEISNLGSNISRFSWYLSITKVSLLSLLVLNIVGFVLNCLPQPGYAHKTKLKAIVALNIVREWVEIAYNLYIVVLGGAGVDRAMHQGRLFMNVWWSLLCLSYLRTRWVGTLVGAKLGFSKDHNDGTAWGSSGPKPNPHPRR